MRVHVYRVSGQTTQMADLNDPEQCDKLLEELMDVMPTGESSQLGTGVAGVLKTFRGGSLNAHRDVHRRCHHQGRGSALGCRVRQLVRAFRSTSSASATPRSRPT